MFLPCFISLEFVKEMNGKLYLKLVSDYISEWLYFSDYLECLIYFKDILIEL